MTTRKRSSVFQATMECKNPGYASDSNDGAFIPASFRFAANITFG